MAVTVAAILESTVNWHDVRRRRGLSQAALGNRAGLTDGAIYLIERGKSTPHMSNRLKLAEVLIDAKPLTEGEIEFLEEALSLDRQTLEQIQQDLFDRKSAPGNAAREELDRKIDEYIAEYGLAAVRNVVDVLPLALKMQEIGERSQKAEPPKPPRTTVVKHPPVQKPGYVEEVEIDYEDLGRVDDEPAKPDTARKVPPRKRTKGA